MTHFNRVAIITRNKVIYISNLQIIPLSLCKSSPFLVWDLLGAESDLNYWVHRPSCCWSLDQYYMKHIPSQGRIGLGSLGLVPQNDLKTRVLQGKTHQLVSEMWCVGCFVRRFLKQKLILIWQRMWLTVFHRNNGMYIKLVITWFFSCNLQEMQRTCKIFKDRKLRSS